MKHQHETQNPEGPSAPNSKLLIIGVPNNHTLKGFLDLETLLSGYLDPEGKPSAKPEIPVSFDPKSLNPKA